MMIARVRNGTVINIEVADKEWINAARPPSGDELVEYDETTKPHPEIGQPYDPVMGFGTQYTYDDLEGA